MNQKKGGTMKGNDSLVFGLLGLITFLILLLIFADKRDKIAFLSKYFKEKIWPLYIFLLPTLLVFWSPIVAIAMFIFYPIIILIKFIKRLYELVIFLGKVFSFIIVLSMLSLKDRGKYEDF